MILRMDQSSSHWGRSTWKGFSTTPSKRSTSAPTQTSSSLLSKINLHTVALSDPHHQIWGEEEEGQGENSRSLLELTSNEGSIELIFLHLATCDLTSWPNCDQLKNYQLHAEPSHFILSYFFKIYFILKCWTIIRDNWLSTTGKVVSKSSRVKNKFWHILIL